jgi:hypothetical protein
MNLYPMVGRGKFLTVHCCSISAGGEVLTAHQCPAVSRAKLTTVHPCSVVSRGRVVILHLCPVVREGRNVRRGKVGQYRAMLSAGEGSDSSGPLSTEDGRESSVPV